MSKDDFKKMLKNVEPLDDAQADQDVMVLENARERWGGYGPATIPTRNTESIWLRSPSGRE